MGRSHSCHILVGFFNPFKDCSLSIPVLSIIMKHFDKKISSGCCSVHRLGQTQLTMKGGFY